MYPGDVPFSWKVTLKDDGVPVDITNSEIAAPVLDDGVEVGSLTVEKTDPVNGISSSPLPRRFTRLRFATAHGDCVRKRFSTSCSSRAAWSKRPDGSPAYPPSKHLTSST
jgi:hypothetical protein